MVTLYAYLLGVDESWQQCHDEASGCQHDERLIYIYMFVWETMDLDGRNATKDLESGMYRMAMAGEDEYVCTENQKGISFLSLSLSVLSVLFMN